MAAGAAKLALVPLLAVAVALGATGIHGRRTHDPERAARAVEILADTGDVEVAREELESFFQSGWVGWDVKTAVEFACATVEGHKIREPLLCLARARYITHAHLSREQEVYRRYGWLAWAAVAPLLIAGVLGASLLAELARRKHRAA
jgi:hypothetical protein